MTESRSKLASFLQPSRQKLALILSTLLIGCIIGVLFRFYGYQPTWRLWGVQSFTPFFIDFRLLPAMVQSLHSGLDPTVNNPSDPMGRYFNYPSIWYLLSYTNLSQADTLWAGILLLILYFAGVFLFPGRLRNTGVALMLLVIFSPAAMLLYERANVDLLIFFLCAVAAAAAEAFTLAAVAIIGVASILKFYPFFGMAAFMFKGKSTFCGILIASGLLFAAYVLVVSRDLHTSWALTMRGRDISYGANVLFQHFLSVTAYIRRLLVLMGFSGTIKETLKLWIFSDAAMSRAMLIVSYTLALAVSVLSLWLGIRRPVRLESSPQRNLIAFWMGAAIYVGTFLLGNNWDYRLAFLLFTVPQLSEWARDDSLGARKIASLTLGLVLLSCWYLFYSSPLSVSAHEVAFVIDELVKWSLFACLTFLLVASVPSHIRSMFALRPQGRRRRDLEAAR